MNDFVFNLLNEKEFSFEFEGFSNIQMETLFSLRMIYNKKNKENYVVTKTPCSFDDEILNFHNKLHCPMFRHKYPLHLLLRMHI